MSTEYAGESLAKKVARVRLYKRTKEALEHRGVKTSDIRVVFLPGPDASEIGALRHILGVRPENVIGIDRDKNACSTLKKRWRGTHAYCADLSDTRALYRIFDALGAYQAHFVHLDLMGNLSPRASLQYAQWGCAVALDGVMAVTYLRAREKESAPNIEMLRDYGAEFVARSKEAGGEGKKLKRLMAADPLRAWSHFGAINFGRLMALAIKDLGMPPTDSPEEWAIWQREAAENFREWLAEADSLQKEYSREATCEILEVPSGTLSAWRAHRTMGTYE